MKKFLSLVLAVIMTMSLVTISASAAEYKDFTDKDEIQYEEAVAVLNRLGIITGYSEGDFRPEGELTRGAAAKIIASLLIGPEAAENLSPTTAPFKDVPLDHTFAGPIAYCSTLKIINGYSDGSFQPGGTLTGYAFSKMLLGALGYDGVQERFTGAGWSMNVMRIGGEARLFDRISFKGNEPVNREQAAQLALNTLKATMVEYTGGINVSTSDGSTMTSPQTRIYKTSNQEYARHILNKKASEQGSVSSTDALYTVEFGEEHFVDLRMTRDGNAYDDFGRPSNEWSYKKVTIGTFPIGADKTYTEQVAHNVITVSNASKARSLELTGNEVSKDTTITVNGKSYTTTEVKSLIGANLTDVGQIADFTDNGTVVEVYIDEEKADWVSDIVVIKTQLMEVKRLGKESVSLDLYDNGSAKKGSTVFGFNQPAIDEKVDNVEIDDAYYTLLSGLKVGDLVAVVPVTTDGGNSYTVAEAYVPETVSGALKKVDTFGTSSMLKDIRVEYGNDKGKESTIGVTVGDTAYNVALWNKDLVDVDGDKLEVTTKDVTLTLDKFGNALLAKDVGATSDFMIVGSYYQNLVNGKLMNYVKGWDISGEELSLNLGSKRSVLPENSGYQPGDLVHYTNSTTGDADWKLESTGVSDVFTGIDNTVSPAAGYSIKASNSRIRIANDDPNYEKLGKVNNPWIDKGIKFIYVTFTEDGDVDSISIKNGVQAASNTELGKSWKLTAGYNSAQLALKLKDNKVNGDSTVLAVVIKNESNDAVASNMLYVVNYAGSAGKTDNGDIVYEYTVAMNGSNGLVDDEMTIYSTKKLSRGYWARYTKVENADFENFYKLSPVDQRNRATSTMEANFTGGRTYPVINNKSLVKVDNTKLYAIDGTKLSGPPDPEKTHALPYITTENDASKLGLDGDKAADVVNLRYAVWVDLTNNGIDSYSDLADLIDDGYSLNDVKVSMIFNDDTNKDNFRQVAMIVVQSIGKASSGGSSSGSYDNGEVGGTYDITDRGVVNVHATLTRPSWAASDAKATGKLFIYADGTVINNPGYDIRNGEPGKDGVLKTDVRVDANVDPSENITWTYDVTWDKANLTINAPTDLTWKGTPELKSIATADGTEVTYTFTLTPNKYYMVTAEATGATATLTNAGSDSSYVALNGDVTLKISSVEEGKAVVVTLTAVEIPPVNGLTVANGAVPMRVDVTQADTEARAGELVKNAVKDLASTESGHVFTMTQTKLTETNDYAANATGSPFSCGEAVPGNVFFPFSCKQDEGVTLVVTDEEGKVAYTHESSVTGPMRVFYIQVTAIGEVMHNEGTAPTNGYLAGDGSSATKNAQGGVNFNYIIIGTKSGIIGKGSFTSPTYTPPAAPDATEAAE